MANIYFGAYQYPSGYVQTGNWNTVTNWYSSPGASGGCCCAGIPGTPAGRLPTTSDTVVIITDLTTAYSGGNWSGAITVDITGRLGAGTYSGIVTAYGTVANCTFNGTFKFNQAYDATSCTFNGAIQPYSGANGNLRIGSGCVVNGAITRGSYIVISGGTFNTAIGALWQGYELSGGTFDRDLVLGSSSSTTTQRVLLKSGLVTSRNVTIDISKYVFNEFLQRNIGGQLTISGGVFSGVITIVKSIYTADASNTPAVLVTGGSYSPPVVITPSIKSGNYMTFDSSAIPIDHGFRAAGGTFSPTILLSGTSNDILGAGLL